MIESKNFNDGKPQFGFLIKDMPEFIEGMTRVRTKGKYPRDNWAQSINTKNRSKFMDENFESMFRHLFAMWQGQELDEDGELHSDHLGVRAGFHTTYVSRGTIYPWADAPEWVNTAVQDFDGLCFWCEEPAPIWYPDAQAWATTTGSRMRFIADFELTEINPSSSMERRPC